jgi:tetratricopeptide (TPR) repeat protein
LLQHITASKLEDGDGDPVWLKAKGDDFFRGGDFLSALNAYSAAIDIDEGMTACYSNRSACYLKLKMFAECLLDCTEVVKQIDAELASISTSNSTATALSEAVRKEIIALKVMLSKSLLRRGSTNCQMGAFANALNDYTRTNNLLFGFVGKRDSASHNSETSKDEDVEFCLPTVTKASLAADLDRIIKLNSADLLKKEGDNLFAQGKLSESWLKYGEALQLVPVHVSCLSNRSACSLARKDIQGCIDDCSCALALLKDSDTSSLQDDNHINMLNTILPSVGSEKRKSWVLKILARRGAAYVQLSLLDEAVEDFRSASGLDPTNEALKSDLNKIINYRDGKERN